MGGKKIVYIVVVIFLIYIIAYLVIFNILKNNAKEGFTELYFVGDLPRNTEIGNKYNFSFGIHNLENKEITYDYVVQFGNQEINQNHIKLKHNDTYVINQGFTVKSIIEISTKVSVQLLNKDQEIHFWVDVE